MRWLALMSLLHLQMVLKCADIGHLTAAPRTHKRWALQLEEEFFRQASTPIFPQAAEHVHHFVQQSVQFRDNDRTHAL